jgi:oligopeptide transport system substrate-binding protein
MLRKSAILLLISLLGGSCAQIQRPLVEPFFANNPPPLKQELRWSNGKIPTTLDPARALTAPEADIVRAIYEGLTELDSKTLTEVPGVAERWETTDQGRTWTFHLRRDARWTNGEPVTAADFVRAWKRLPTKASSTSYLYSNIAGLGDGSAKLTGPETDAFELLSPDQSPDAEPEPAQRTGTPSPSPPERTQSISALPNNDRAAKEPGVEAIDRQTLRVILNIPDKEFPRLVAHPIFRPVPREVAKLEPAGLDSSVVTNGAFRVVTIDNSCVTLEPSETYWDKERISLERVQFRAVESAEAALDAYRKGEIDVVTNASFTAAALKLLSPYEDFRRTTHAALNFYEVNTAHKPFDDRRVREALAIAIDRERLAHADLGGTTAPAPRLLPLNPSPREPLSFDVARARGLLANAGYPDGAGFPVVRLVVNRNDVQQRLARSVARMWKSNLNIETSVITREFAEMDDARAAGDYDLIRRGVVLGANDELVALLKIFGDISGVSASATPEPARTHSLDHSGDESVETAPQQINIPAKAAILHEFRAIPLYFPLSYALVKPYVDGFELNALDAPSLKEVRINNEWRREKPR